MFHKSFAILSWVILAFVTLVAESPRYSWAQANSTEFSPNSDGSDSQALKRDDTKDLAMFNQASKSIEQGRTEIGVEILHQLIQLRNDFDNMSELTLQISHKLAIAYFKQEDYTSTIYMTNAMGNSKPTSDLWCGLRAAAYKRLQLSSIELDELRNAVRMNPEDITNRKELAFELAQTEVPTLRNGLEALLAVEHLEKEFANDPLIAKCIAAAAAEAGDFPLAIRQQSQYIKQVKPERLEFESNLLDIYEGNLTQPNVIPAFDVNQLVRANELPSIASHSMVSVRLHGTTECIETQTGNGHCQIIKRDHIGVALNRMGTILVSHETIRPPAIERLDGKGPDVVTTRWAVEPAIEVHLLATGHTSTKLLGKANIVGADEATGLAVIQIVQEKPLEFFDELQPIQFQPEYRAFDPQTKVFLVEMFEPRIDAIKPGDSPSLKLVHPNPAATTTYDDAALNSTSVAKLRMVPDSLVETGSPYFNLIGECVGISHRVRWDGKSKVVAIPPAVCARIAAKLAAYGKVERAFLPFTMTGVTTAATKNSAGPQQIAGMLVSAVPKDVAIYQPLLYKLITEVDGIPTPTLTEWLVASERAWSRGVDTLALTVYDDKLGAFSIVYIPTTKAGSLQAAAPRVDSEAAAAEACKWMESNVHPDIYAKTGITLSRRIKRAIADNRNFSMFFDGYAMSNDLPVALLVRDGELVTQTLDMRTTELSGPGRGNISFDAFGKPNLRSDQSLKIVKLQADSSRSTQHGELVLNLEIAGLMAAQGKYAVRIQFLSPAKVPILIPLQDVPAPNTSRAMALTVALAEESVSQNLGDVAVVDIVEVSGDLKAEEYSALATNGWVTLNWLMRTQSNRFWKLNETPIVREPTMGSDAIDDDVVVANRYAGGRRGLRMQVDYSARGTFIHDPDLKLNQCGLPKAAVLQLFRPFIIRRMLDVGLAEFVEDAEAMLGRPVESTGTFARNAWISSAACDKILEEVISGQPVLLSRAPSLNRSGIQALQPVLTAGNVIRIHPLVFQGFDNEQAGDQVTVHLPLSQEAQREASTRMMPANNLYGPANGAPIFSPSRDIVMGCYYTTITRTDWGCPKYLGDGMIFASPREVDTAYALGKVALHATVHVRLPKDKRIRVRDEQKTPTRSIIETTVGRVLIYRNSPSADGVL